MNLGKIAGSNFALNDDDAAINITGLTADSRKVEAGFLFAALPGTQVDGAKFIPGALEKGAAAILVGQESNYIKPETVSVPILEVSNPRETLAHFAARFYQKQPEVSIAVTGTNGKTSIVSFVRQIWRHLGRNAASLGTIGLMVTEDKVTESLTTPEPVALHKMLSGLTDQGIDHLALEASSHGLQQRRMDGVVLQAGAFTNISQDHLDYHKTFEDYFSQKLRLFSEVLPDGSTVVVNMDAKGSQQVADIARSRGLKLLTVGESGQSIHLAEVTRDGYGQRLQVIYGGSEYSIHLPLVGAFQASNVLVAAGLCLATGSEPDAVFQSIEHLKGAKGRLENAGQTAQNVPVFIDYAHTPDALDNVLQALRPYVSEDGGRLIVVFGCGGDRDKGKRPLMGKAAMDGADVVYVTDDNPRSEDPAQIRSEILAAAQGAIEIGDRQQAIDAAISEAKPGDLVLVAGKGHETGQIIGDQVVPFSDHEAVKNVIRK